jgi:hypothetical protein
MTLRSITAVALCQLALSSCSGKPIPAKAALRSCVLTQARVLATKEKRRPTFVEAQHFALNCDRRGVPSKNIDTLSCALSERWNRCGRLPPTD